MMGGGAFYKRTVGYFLTQISPHQLMYHTLWDQKIGVPQGGGYIISSAFSPLPLLTVPFF